MAFVIGLHGGRNYVESSVVQIRVLAAARLDLDCHLFLLSITAVTFFWKSDDALQHRSCVLETAHTLLVLTLILNFSQNTSVPLPGVVKRENHPAKTKQFLKI